MERNRYIPAIKVMKLMVTARLSVNIEAISN
jgi:hypothetical protein